MTIWIVAFIAVVGPVVSYFVGYHSGYDCGERETIDSKMPEDALPCGHRRNPHRWSQWGDPGKVTRLVKQEGRNFHFPEKYGIPSPSFHGAEHEESVQNALALKVPGISFSGYGKPGYKPQGFNVTAAQQSRSTKGFANRFEDTPQSRFSSKSDSRKAASALIAEIPYDLAAHIARVFKPVRFGV